MRRCQGCGFWVSSGWEPPEGLAKHYGSEYQQARYVRPARRKARSARFIVRQIEGLRRPGRLLDVGSSLGYVVAAAQERGWEAYGVDVGDEAVAHCQAQGLNCLAGDMRHLPFADGFFDVVHCRHVLEHDIEVYQSLEEMRRVLADDGLLVLEVPDADAPKVRRRGATYRFWWAEHMVCFTRTTLAELMRRAGFAPVRVPTLAGSRSGGAAGAVPFLVWRLAHVLPERLGLTTYLWGIWRKSGEPDWEGAGR